MFRIVLIRTLPLIFGCIPFLISAQPGRITAKEVEMETRFIDANRERILGNYDKAIPIYEAILKEDEDNHAAAYELSRIFSDQEEYDKAIRFANLAVELDPSNAWYRQFLADIYQKIGSNEEAVRIYKELIRQNPENEEYYFKLAYYLVRANQIQEAVKVYDQLEDLIGVTEEIVRRKQALYMGIGDYKRAGREIERLIEAFPDNLEYQHLLAEFYRETGRDEEAMKVYQYILENDPENVKAQLALAGKPSGDNDEIQYLNSLGSVLNDPGVDIDVKVKALLPIIQRVADTGDRQLGEKALELTLLLEQQYPDEAKAYAASADLLFYLNRRQEAIAKYEKTLELDDTIFPVWEQLLHAYLEEGDYEQLRERSEEAMDYFPNKPSAYWMHGLASRELGDNEDALNSLEQALLMAGNDGQMIYNVQSQLGMVYDALGRPRQSDEAFEAALKLNPKGLEVLNNYAFTLAQRGEELEKARQMIQTVNDIRVDWPAYQDTYGWVFYKMKDYNNAKKWIGEALNNGGNEDPGILEHYGDVLFQLEDQDGALQYWMRALDNGSSSRLLEKKINDKQLYE